MCWRVCACVCVCVRCHVSEIHKINKNSYIKQEGHLSKSPKGKSSPIVISSSGGANFKQLPRCCLQEIRVLPNTPALIMFPISTLWYEMEVVLPEGVTFHLLNGRQNRYRQREGNDACLVKGDHMQVTYAIASPIIHPTALPGSKSQSTSR